MRDLLLILVVIAFFALAALFVRGCHAIVGDIARPRADERRNAIGLVLAVVVLGYLVFVLLYPERLG